MYIPKHFEVTEQEEIFAFIGENAFGQLVSHVGERLFSTHMPFLLSDDRSKIIGHIAKQNPQHYELEGQEVLITLQGAHDYISPSWYGSAGVPTWNYQALHIYGRCTVFHDNERLGHVVETLTQKYEAAFSQPWRPEYNVSLRDAIVGIEVSIDEIQCKYKLSQNRSEQDRKQVIRQLEVSGSNKLAAAMACHTL